MLTVYAKGVVDDNCNGVLDDGASCSGGLHCVNGSCVP